MFAIGGAAIAEIALRVTLIYVACMVLLRVSGRREMSQVSPMDLLAMLLVSETVSPALTGGDDSVTGGVIAAGTLFALVFLNGLIVARSGRAERVLQGHAAVLIDAGRVVENTLRRYRITDEDLRAILHQHGVLHVREVARAFVESDGEVTVITREDYEAMRSHLARR